MENILFLLHLPPPIHGSSIVGLSIKENKIINNEFKCNYINLLASQNVSESGIISFKKLFRFVNTWIKVLISITQKKPKLCYLALTTTGPAFYRDLLIIALLKAYRIKLIYHLHNKGISLHQHKIIYRLAYHFVFRKTEVILLSELLYPDIANFVNKSKIHICPNGIPIENHSIKDSSSQEIVKVRNLKAPVQILFLSNLIESKGVYILLEACALLKSQKISFECIFIGGEGNISFSEFKEHVHQFELDGEVFYQGAKYGKDKINAFIQSDIFVFPTYNETFGLVNLEAMQQSKPIISTFEGGIPDVIEDRVTGFLVPPKDAIKLAEKLELLIKNPNLRMRMGFAGRQKFENEFTLEIFETRLYQILKQAIQKQ